ncbi:MAG: sugar ABC transporter permease [Clostridiaceae bacterium]
MNKRSGYIFAAVTIIPGFFLVALFLIYPMLQMVYQSFFNVSSLLGNPSFAGLDNYKSLLTDENFIIALKNTIFLTLLIPIAVPFISLVLAVLVTQTKLKEKALYRVLFFFPSVLPMVSVGILWQFIYHPTIGVINSALNSLGLEAIAFAWLGDERFAMWAVVITMIWQAAGYLMVMNIAGIDRIPLELYESATLDGAGALRKFTAVTVPFLWEVVRMTIVFAIGIATNVGFILTAVMTAGGPGLSTTVLLQYMFTQAFQNSNFGYAMSIAVVVLLISFVISLISNRLTNRETIEY